jgi:DNA-binding CsgD family transcriptional regulator
VAGIPDLLERDLELTLVERLIGEVARGSGRVLVIRGSAGLGKTALLAAARERAASAGMRVLVARGGELEAELAFGVVRQLFERMLARGPKDERAELLAGAARLAAPVLLVESAATGDPSAALHGLYWLCANLAERRALALIVDDAHWADADSLRWLSYLTRRIDALPVLAVLALRSDAPQQERPILDALAGEPNVQRLALRPLTEAATAQVIKSRLDCDAESAFCRACHEATGGNPFYLRELLTMIREERLKPTAENAEHIPKLAPATVARAILVRIGRLGKDAVALARAVAVLGPDAEIRSAAALVGLDGEAAQLAADALAAGELLRPTTPLAFTHPIVAASVVGDIEAGARSIAHKRAARLLDDEGAPLDRVALHLVATAPQGDPWVIERLAAAATWSAERAAPQAAAAFLMRALDEPPRRPRRADVLFELGRIERLIESDKALAHLGEAVEATDDPYRQAERAIELVSALQLAGRPVEAVAVCDAALTALTGADRELELRLEAARCRAAIQDPDTVAAGQELRERFRGALAGDTPAERELLVELAHRALAHPASASDVAETIAVALAGDRLIGEQGGDAIVVFEAITALTYADRLDEADHLIAQALSDVRKRGSLTGFVNVSTFRAQTRLRRGLVAEAEAEARAALDAARLDIPTYVLPGTFAILIEVLVEHGDLDSAEHELRRSGLTDTPPKPFPFTMLLHSRAMLRLAQRRAREALADALICGTRQDALRLDNPAVIPWRSTAALAHVVLGEAEAAQRLAREDVRLARGFGAPSATGIALRVAGRVAPVRDGLPLLEEAVAVLAESPARLEHARALVDHGMALRRLGVRSWARNLLREGLDLAYHCGATAVVERARAELRAAGARPRRDVVRGVDALTASELRIAQMAAAGMTNREIAEAIFVTSKTVETHLHRVFQKLDVASRRQLGTVLGPGPPPAHVAVGPRQPEKTQGVLPDAEPLPRA